VALTELIPPPAIESLFEPLLSSEPLCEQLTRVLAPVWPPRWLKAPPKKPKPPTTRKAIRGNQTSVYRLLAAYAQERKQEVISSAQ
jgi:hypothetical protein